VIEMPVRDRVRPILADIDFRHVEATRALSSEFDAGVLAPEVAPINCVTRGGCSSLAQGAVHCLGMSRRGRSVLAGGISAAVAGLAIYGWVGIEVAKRTSLSGCLNRNVSMTAPIGTSPRIAPWDLLLMGIPGACQYTGEYSAVAFAPMFLVLVVFLVVIYANARLAWEWSSAGPPQWAYRLIGFTAGVFVFVGLLGLFVVLCLSPLTWWVDGDDPTTNRLAIAYVGSFIVMIPAERVARNASNAVEDRFERTTKHYGATGSAAVNVATGVSAAVGTMVAAAAASMLLAAALVVLAAIAAVYVTIYLTGALLVFGLFAAFSS
jgi:hypothetical protein